MDCFIDYIGINGCGNVAPASGLYLNELAGISVESIAKLSKPEQDTYLDVWADIQKRAVRKFNSQVIAMFAKRYRLKRLRDNFRIEQEVQPNYIPALSNSFRGFGINLDPTNTAEFSPLVALTLANLRFYSTQVGTFNFTIGREGGVGANYNFSQDCVVGWNNLLDTYSIPFSAIGTTFGVVVNCATLETAETIVAPNESGCCSCCLTSSCSVEIKGMQIDNGLITESQNAHGFSCDIALGCSFEALMCVNRTLFSTAVWYLMGAETMIERIFSDRINKWTTIDKKKAQDLYDYYLSEQEKEVAQVVDGIDLIDYGCCIECDPEISYRWAEL